MNKKSLEKQDKITMETFLRSCLQIDNDQVIDALSRLTHKDFKRVCREIYKLYVCSIPFEAVQREDLYEGNIVLVYDAHHNFAPYKNPSQKSIDKIHEELFSYDMNSPRSKAETEARRYSELLDKYEELLELYEELIDVLEEQLTVDSFDVSSVGPFEIPSDSQLKLLLERGKKYDKYQGR